MKLSILKLSIGLTTSLLLLASSSFAGQKIHASVVEHNNCEVRIERNTIVGKADFSKAMKIMESKGYKKYSGAANYFILSANKVTVYQSITGFKYSGYVALEDTEDNLYVYKSDLRTKIFGAATAEYGNSWLSDLAVKGAKRAPECVVR